LYILVVFICKINTITYQKGEMKGNSRVQLKGKNP